MPAPTLNSQIQLRLTTLNALVPDKTIQKTVANAFQKHQGDWEATLEALKPTLSKDMLERVDFSHSLATLTDDHAPLATLLATQPNVHNLRQLALTVDTATLTTLIKPGQLPPGTVGDTTSAKVANVARSIQSKLFVAETSAVVQRMAQTAVLPIADAPVRDGLATFLNNQPDFNIRQTSVYTALQQPGAFDGIADDHREAVVGQLKIVQRVQALTMVPGAIPVLMEAKLHSGSQVADMSEPQFMKSFGGTLGEATAQAVYANATNVKIRNEAAMMALKEAHVGTGVALIDQAMNVPVKTEMRVLAAAAPKTPTVTLDYEALFGSVDFCECGECTSVYSPAAYFVELLQYLRNNNLDPDATGPVAIKTDPKDISGTPLESLFARRPDLGCLELTCANTNTVLPYVDLVNEVMENYVVSQHTVPFNVGEETTGELLAQPQHTNYEAYCILKSAVYPFTLPYHQPIDAARIFLNYLETSRYELLNMFRAVPATLPAGTPTPDANAIALATETERALDRAIDAEFLTITQEEHIILTREAFQTRLYFDLKTGINHTEAEYRHNIGVRMPWAYYGYQTEAAMLDADVSVKSGLSFVKKQFLPRTGIQYTDLVDLLRTQTINPNYPQGKSRTIFESLRFSYRFLQNLVGKDVNDSTRFDKLIAFLEVAQPMVPLVEALLHPDPCKPQSVDTCLVTKDLRHWVKCNFERVGKIIVLESGDGPRLPVYGKLLQDGRIPVGTLHQDGTITDTLGKQIGRINEKMQAVDLADKPLFADKDIIVANDDGQQVAVLSKGILRQVYQRQADLTIAWLPAQDSCNIEKVRLMHLNGSPVETSEYDRMQRFIRLWRKLGWTIDETDKALVGLANQPATTPGTSLTPATDADAFAAFTDDCHCTTDGEDCDCDAPETTMPIADITPALLHQLVAVKKLLDATGLPLIKLLTFWGTISTVGNKSLYAKLFLTHNLLAIDAIFHADNNGNYLTKSATLSAHLPVLMAALNLNADGIDTIAQYKNLPDQLTVATVSTLYRFSLLAKTLHVRLADLVEIIRTFGDPFLNADATWTFMQQYGQMEEAGFTARQLNYIIRDHDDPQHPLTPTKKSVLVLAKTLFDGLTAIDKAHPDTDPAQPETYATDVIRTKTALFFESAIVERIVGLVEGTTVYATNAPANLTITIPDALRQKVRYEAGTIDPANPLIAPKKPGLQVTGILTPAEEMQLRSLSALADWGKAIDRINKQTLALYNDALYPIFPTLPDYKANLLNGDINLPPAPPDTPDAIENTAPKKRFYFLTSFLPFLRKQLSHRFLFDTLSAPAGVSQDVADALLTDVLTDDSSTVMPKPSLLTTFEGIKTHTPSGTGWTGYLIPAADAGYTFVVESETQPAPVLIDGMALVFRQQEDPSDVWLSEPQALKGGRIYTFSVSGLTPDLKDLTWKTPTSPRTALSPAVLLPDFAGQAVESAFKKFQKAALVANGFALTADEVRYFGLHGADFDGLDFNAFSLNAFLRLQAYTALRDGLPKTDTTLIQFLGWAGTAKPEAAPLLIAKIAYLTGWKPESLTKLIAPGHFSLGNPTNFRHEKNLIKLRDALAVADKIGMDIDRLFEWAVPTSKFWDCHAIAESIRESLQARYLQTDWEQVVKPLSDQLREHQKLALIAYLLVQPGPLNFGVTDADGLFEFFLIDVQMDACMETSRIKQGISSVQTFIQRCFLGLEADKGAGVANTVLDRQRWEWMQRYRLWEANRKVFLYPENWIESNLRDDKSPFFSELESELLQKDVNKDTVRDALKSYLYKLDEVANLEVVGLFVDGTGQKIHVFARTRNAPYFFFYRHYRTDEKNWIPWQKVQVDIPSYDVEDKVSKNITGNGCYLTPVVWNNRLLIFFPQFLKKVKANNANPVKVSSAGGTTDIPAPPPVEFWEIKMAWSEYRNGRWTQKQVSKEAVYTNVAGDTIDNYKFVPILSAGGVLIDVEDSISGAGDVIALDAFLFTGSKLEKGSRQNMPASTGTRKFHYDGTSLQSLQSDGKQTQWLPTPTVSNSPFPVSFNYGGDHEFYHPFSHQLMGKIETAALSDFFASNLPKSVDPVNSLIDGAEQAEAFGFNNGKYNELSSAYGIYNWELFFHTPTLLADRLSKTQQFEEAMQWYHYVFNPLAKGTDAIRFWRFFPFTKANKTNFLETYFNGLKANTADDQINTWRNHPFAPHVVARDRPTAYMKWVVMKYLDNLIAWGDYLFRQDTIESINQATQLYILAGHILGPRPQFIPKRGKTKPQTYNSLLDKWDAFGNAMTELELIAPYSNQTDQPVVVKGPKDIAFANIFGTASALYFCLPNNPKLAGYWDTLADRLFKIRHCENIEGVFRKLPLFEPPIDPALLVQATAQGLSLASVLNDLNSPQPNYRFPYLMQKALELCGELKSMGSALLSAIEKKDAEVLSQLRAKHESSILNLVMEVKKQQVDEANKSLESLRQNRVSPAYRMQYYLDQMNDATAVPDENGSFSPIANSTAAEKPQDQEGLKLLGYEREEMQQASDAKDLQDAIGKIESLASLLHALPLASADVKPIGIGVGLGWGGSNLGNLTQAIARWMQTDAAEHTFSSSSASRKAGFLRQLQDRVLQANTAGFELIQIDKQITTQQIRINIANQEITNQQRQIDNANEVEEYLRNKYTNADLYIWMENSLRTVYHQVYTLAFELAKKAEKTFRFERGLSSTNFIQAGYWESGYGGLLSGERLYTSLKQLEAAYQEKRGHDFEITKHISLQQLNPLALIQLKATGTCEFALPEVLFDMDFPGHYLRRIKSVGVSVPCLAGPYTSLNCTLRLLENKFRVSSIATGKNDYAEKTDETDERFSTVNIPITSIAVSTGQNDSGVFDLNFHDERYMPFEGAGVASKWRLELPAEFRQFDYETISDVVMHLRYTSVDGGDKLKKPATDALLDYLKNVDDQSREEGLFAFFDLVHDFPNEWYRATQPVAAGANAELIIGKIASRLPFFTQGQQRKLAPSTFILIVPKSAAAPVSLAGNPFTPAVDYGDWRSYRADGDGISLADPATLTVAFSAMPTRAWLIMQYTV